MRSQLIFGLAAAAALVTAGALAQPLEINPQPPPPPAFPGQTRAPAPKTPSPPLEVQVIARGLQFPWSMAFLPDGRLMVAEKWGSIRLLRPDVVKRPGFGALPNAPTWIVSAPIQGLPGVKVDTHGVGLHGIALDPDFARNRLVYFAYFAPPPGEDPAIWPYWVSEQRGKTDGMETVARARLSADGKRFEGVKVLLQGVDRRVLFGRDGKLYVTGLDRYRLYRAEPDAPLADRMTFGGRVARINPDGSIPKDNPFLKQPGAPPDAYAYGLRDPGGAALDPTGQLWVSDHGPQGGDELNLVQAGADFGWPVISYGTHHGGKPINGGLTAKAGMTQPVYFWNPDVGPSGMTFYTGDMFPAWKGSLLIGAVTVRKLIRLEMEGGRVVSEEQLLEGRKQRIRDVAQAPDGSVFLLTDDGDVLRLVPKA